MRFASCLTVALTAMDATLGGSGGIPTDPNLETGRDEAKALEKYYSKKLEVTKMEKRKEQY